MAKRVKIGVGLDGRPVYVRVGKRVRVSLLERTNISPQDQHQYYTQRDAEAEAFDQLPVEVREWMSERMTVDQTTVAMLEQWQAAQRRGDGVGEFLRYLDRVNAMYLNQTRDIWDTPPPMFRETPPVLRPRR